MLRYVNCSLYSHAQVVEWQKIDHYDEKKGDGDIMVISTELLHVGRHCIPVCDQCCPTKVVYSLRDVFSLPQPHQHSG